MTKSFSSITIIDKTEKKFFIEVPVDDDCFPILSKIEIGDSFDLFSIRHPESIRAAPPFKIADIKDEDGKREVFIDFAYATTMWCFHSCFYRVQVWDPNVHPLFQCKNAFKEGKFL
jgi:hypothetical protein